MKKQQSAKKKTTKKNKRNIQILSKSNRKKPHYKKQESGIYNKKKFKGKTKKQLETAVEELVEQAVQVEQIVPEPVAVVPEPIQPEPVVQPEEKPNSASFVIAKEKKPKKSAGASSKLLMQFVLAGVFSMMGFILLFGTVLFIYMPVRQSNRALSDTRLQTRMELSLMISEVFPSMHADDELTDILKRSLENKAKTLRSESTEIQNDIFALSKTNQDVMALLAEIGYTDQDFYQISENDSETKVCLDAINGCISTLDGKINELGVAALKEEIAKYKGTTTTVTREDENGQTITETVTTGGLVPELQKKKDELQKQYDVLEGKLTALEQYLKDNKSNIEAMYNRLENPPAAANEFAMMEAIVTYVQENPKENIFLEDIAQKLQSFPGESKEEDDILFIMKVEAETGIRMQTVNYGQDYQHKRLSNGMLLCYEVYSIPYYSTYQGLKNLIAYFNQNDDFYASVYTLSVQYNPTTKTFMGNIVILHYYLLEEGAEYVPPTINEVIQPGVDGIFGAGSNIGNSTSGPQSDYTASQIEEWLAGGMTLEEVRDKLKSEGYPATELAWILKQKYTTQEEILGFLELHGDGKDYTDTEVLTSFFEVPNNPGADKGEDDTNEGGNEDDENNENKPSTGKQSNYTVEKVEKMMNEDGMSIVEVRDQIKAAGYPAIELAWVLHEEYKTEDEILGFMISHGEINYLTIDEAAELFECSVIELQAVYNS